MMPMLAARGRADGEMRETAANLLARVGLTPWRDHKASDISGGQQQRVAIARALAMTPLLVLADEPSGNLDTENADAVFDLMRDVNETSGTTFLIVTHDPRLARRCDRIVELVDGRIVSDAPNSTSCGAASPRDVAPSSPRPETQSRYARFASPYASSGASSNASSSAILCSTTSVARKRQSIRRATSCRAGIDRNARVSSLKPTVL